MIRALEGIQSRSVRLLYQRIRCILRDIQNRHADIYKISAIVSETASAIHDLSAVPNICIDPNNNIIIAYVDYIFTGNEGRLILKSYKEIGIKNPRNCDTPLFPTRRAYRV